MTLFLDLIDFHSKRALLSWFLMWAPFLGLGAAEGPPNEKETRKIKSLITNLDAEEFAARESATKALCKMAGRALGSLTEALPHTTNAEAQVRIQSLLENIKRLQAIHRQNDRPIAWGHSVGGLRMGISANIGKVKGSEVPTWKVHYQNVSMNPVTINKKYSFVSSVKIGYSIVQRKSGERGGGSVNADGAGKLVDDGENKESVVLRPGQFVDISVGQFSRWKPVYRMNGSAWLTARDKGGAGWVGGLFTGSISIRRTTTGWALDRSVHGTRKSITREDWADASQIWKDFESRLPVDTRTLQSVRAVLPAGWNVKVQKDRIRIERKEQVLATLEMPGMSGDELSESYSFWYTLTPTKYISPAQHKAMRKRNAALKVQAQQLFRDAKIRQIPRKFDKVPFWKLQYFPRSEEESKIIIKYKALYAEIKRLPTLYLNGQSFFIDGDVYMFDRDSEEEECIRIERKVAKIFGRYGIDPTKR